MSLIFTQIIFYGSWVVLFFLLMHRRQTLRAGRVMRFLVLTTLLTTFVWMRWIEPYQVALERVDLGIGIGKKIAFISDMHLGVFKDEPYLQRIVDTINKQPGVDMVIIGGDLTYRPPEDQKKLATLFRGLRDLRVPVYAVLGNHDLQKPGPDIKKQLVAALEKRGVTYLENDVIDFGSWTLVGLGDHDAGQDNTFLLQQFHVADQVVVVAHNPDTISSYTNYNADVTLAGHTHCGQIRLPRLHRYVGRFIIPTTGPFDCGLHTTKYTTLYVSPGLGEVILPLRWFNPPTISIIRL